MESVGTILDGWQKDGIGYVRFELPDMHGISRSKTIPIAHAADYAERGLNMYGGVSVLDSRSDVVPGTLYHEEVGYGDQLLFPDPDSAAVVPWVDRTARLICDARWYDGRPLAATPRHVFRRALEKAREMGFEPLMGSEFEFYLLTGDTHEPLFDGHQIFNTVHNDYVPTIRRIVEEMPKVGVDVITANCEYAGSQWEINFAPGRGLAGPDQAFTFKNGVKEIAKQDGYLATFMSKPYATSAGSGCHTHLSLLHADSGENAFADADDPSGMNDTCRSFIAGLLTYARAIDAVIAPTVNCLRRRRRHTFSPTNVSWGHEDRSALVRVKGGQPRVQAHRVPGTVGPVEPLPGRRRVDPGRPPGRRGQAVGARTVEAGRPRRGGRVVGEAAARPRRLARRARVRAGDAGVLRRRVHHGVHDDAAVRALPDRRSG